MAKIYIMQGLPASGKSTKAEEIMKLDGNTVRINRDLLRTMLHFNKWSGIKEKYTKMAARTLAEKFLLEGVNVIIDDTNLIEGTRQSWVDLAKATNSKIQHVVMDTPLLECIERDSKREKKVGKNIIVNMALGARLYPKPHKPFILCDLDGTLCDISHRLHFVRNLPEGTKKDWKSFFEHIPFDKMRNEVAAKLVDYIVQGYEVIFLSARPEDHRKATEEWLANHFPQYVTLIMRPSNDKRDDELVKREMFERHFIGYHVQTVIDDRPRVIRMWREMGLEVIDVGSGVEF